MYKLLLFVSVISLFSITGLNAQTSLQQAADLYKQGNYKEALSAFEQIINSGSAVKEVYSGAIDCAIKLQQYNTAVEIIGKAESRFGVLYEWSYLKAQIFAQDGRFQLSISEMKKLLKSYPDSVSVRNFLVDVYSSKGSKEFKNESFEEALQSFREAYKLSPSKLETARNYLAACLRLKRYDEALPLVKKLYSPTDKDPEIGVLFFQLLVQAEKYGDALKIAQSLAKAHPENIDILVNEAEAYRYAQDIDGALAKYRVLRKKYPKSKKVFNTEIDWLLNTAQGDSAIARCREFLINSPDDPEIMSIMARQYQVKKSFDTARTIYREMRSKDLNRDAAIPIAECFLLEGKKDSAIIELTAYVRSGGKNPDAFLTLHELLWQTNRISEMKYSLLLAIERNPTYGVFSTRLARQYLNENLLDTAMIYLEPVKSLFAQYPEVSYISARIYEIRTDTAKAVFHYTRFLRHSMKQSQLLQAQITTSISGNNMMNPDSVKNAEKAGTQLDTLTRLLRESFQRIRTLTDNLEFPKILNELIADIPQGTPLYIARAKFRKEQGDYSSALSDIEIALSLAPFNEEVQKEAGDFYYEMNNFESAYAAYRVALSKNNKVKLYYDRIIELAFKLKRTEEVIEYWKRLYENDKELTLLKECLIELYQKTDRFDEASKLLDE